MKKKLSLFLVALFALVAYAASTTWKVTADGATSIEAGTTLTDNDVLLAKTVYASNVVGGCTIGNEDFDNGFQVRVAAFPSGDDKTGTEQSGSTPVVITAKKDCDLTVYYRRQSTAQTENKGAYADNDGKDLIVYKQSDLSKLSGTLTIDHETDDGKYGWATKKVSLTAGETYTLCAKGTTIQFFGFTYETEDPQPTETKTIYMRPGVWASSNDITRYAVYAFNVTSNDNQWFDLAELETDEGTYSADIPENFENIILVRMDGTKPENSWDNAWNQTEDINFTQTADNTLFTIDATDWGTKTTPYTTSEYTGPEAPAQKYNVLIDNGQVFGTVEADKYEAAEGDQVALKVSVKQEYQDTYELDALTVTGVDGSPIETHEIVGSDYNYAFTMPAQNVTVSATFKEAVADSYYYQKVTSTTDITDGKYLIVYEDGAVAFNGALTTLDAVSNTVAVEIKDGIIASSDATDAAAFTIDVTNGTLQSASGFYIGVTSNSNGLKQSETADSYIHSFAIDGDGNAVIKAEFEESTMTLRYNKASNQTRFRYYKSGQEAIALYKLTEGSGGGGADDPVYIAAGDKAVWGSSWDAKDTNNQLTKDNDGKFSITKEDLNLAAGEYGYKIVKDGTWIPDGTDNDKKLSIAENGQYKVVLTVDPEAEADYLATATKTGEYVEPEPVYVAVGAKELWGVDAWTIAEENTLIKDNEGKYSITKENLLLPEGQYGYKIVKDGNTWIPDGTDNEKKLEITETAYYNVTLTVDPADVENYLATAEKAASINTIAEVQAAEAKTEVTVQGIIYASAAKGAVLYDGDDYLYYYNTKNALNIGQKVLMAGKVGKYGGASQLTADATITDLGTVDGVVYPDPVELKAADFDAIAQENTETVKRQYVTYTGKLTISGNYYNIAIEGTTANIMASLVAPKEDISELNGKDIVVKGYMMYKTSNNQGQFAYTVATSVEEYVAKQPYSVSFTTDKKWDNVYAYTWSGDNVTAAKVEQLGKWPGVAMKGDKGVYTYEFEAIEAPEMIIFNNGLENEAKEQTGDLPFVNGTTYTFSEEKATAWAGDPDVAISKETGIIIPAKAFAKDEVQAEKIIHIVAKEISTAAPAKGFNSDVAELKPSDIAILRNEEPFDKVLIEETAIQVVDDGYQFVADNAVAQEITDHGFIIKPLGEKKIAVELVEIEKAKAPEPTTFAEKVAAALEAGTGEVTVTMEQDEILDAAINVPLGKQLVIDGANKTLTLGEATNFVLNDGFTLKNVNIDASALGQPLVQMNATPAMEPVESGQYIIKNAITFDNVKATGLTKNLFSDAGKSYAYEHLNINNSVFEYATQTGIVMNLAASMAINFNITNSTFYSKEAGSANFIAMSGKRPWQITGYEEETGKLTVANNTFYNVAKSKQFMNTNTLKGQKYLYVFNSNIFVDVSNKKIYGNMTNNKNQLTTDGQNTYLFDGAFFAETNYNGDEGLQSDPSFKDAANGDFTIGASTAQAKFKTGDPRWVVEYVKPTFSSLVAAALAAPVENVATLTLDDDYAVDAAVAVPLGTQLVIDGANKTLTLGEATNFVLNDGFTLKNVNIDASALGQPLVQMNATPAMEPVESGQYIIKNAITFDNVKATGLTKNLFSDAGKSYVYEHLNINNSVFEYATQTGIVMNLAASMAINFNITNSTFYSKEAGSANFIAMSGKRPWQITGYEEETGKLTVANNTFYNVAKSKQFMNTNTLKGQKYLYVFNSNIFVDVSNKKIYGNMTNNKNQLTTDGQNTYLFDGAFFAETNYNGDEGLQSDPSFKDAANGDFTIGATTAQAKFKTGDPRWLVQYFGYYLAGNMNDWKPVAEYELKANTAAEGVEEYMITVDLAADAQFKIAKSDGTTIDDANYYPQGMGNNYGENGELQGAGKYTVYFRPNADGGDDWFYHVIYAQKLYTITVENCEGMTFTPEATEVAAGTKVWATVAMTDGYEPELPEFTDTDTGDPIAFVEGETFGIDEGTGKVWIIMPAQNLTIKAKASKVYRISLDLSQENGSATCISVNAEDPTTFYKKEGKEVYLNVTPNAGYTAEITVTAGEDPVEVTAEAGTYYEQAYTHKFIMPAKAVIVKVTFTKSTGINGIDAEDADDNTPIYNLSGQKVTKSYKGVVIKNGKKYMQK